MATFSNIRCHCNKKVQHVDVQFVQPQPFNEALDKLGARSPVASTLNSDQWRDVPVALRERAFFSSEVESVRFLQRAKDTLSDYLAGARDPATGALQTGSRAAFVQQMQRFALAEGMGSLKPGQKGTIKDITSEGRLGLIFDVQTKAARDFGHWKQGMDPTLLAEFPAQRFIRVRRVKKPRSYHQAALGEIRLKTDLSFWLALNPDFGVPWGPWGFNSGCDVEDVDRAEAERRGLLKPGQTVQPVERDFNEGLAASVRGLDDGLVRTLISRFGDQVELAGDQVVWKGQSAAQIPVPPPLPVPATQPPAAPEEPPARTFTPRPVSDAFEVHLGEEGARQVKLALDAADSVHDDGALRQMPVDSMEPGVRTLGLYCAGEHGVWSVKIRENGPWPALSFLHETGHILDQQALGADAIYDATSQVQPGAPLAPWLNAVTQTASVQALREQLAAATTPQERRYLQYLLQPDELWARSYAQYIAERSADPELAAQLAAALAAEPERQWEGTDFVPVSTAIDDLFASLGWLR